MVASRAEEQAAWLTAWEPKTGEAWIARNTAYIEAVRSDPSLCPDGSDAAMAVLSEKAQQGLKVLDPAGKLTPLLNATGWASHPEVVRALVDLQKRSGEGTQITGHSAAAGRTKSDKEVMYPWMYNEDGTPKANPVRPT